MVLSQLQRNSGDMAGILMIAVHTGGVVTEPLALLARPVVLLKSEFTPLAVFPMPVTLFKSALTPLTVLMSPVLLLKEALALSVNIL